MFEGCHRLWITLQKALFWLGFRGSRTESSHYATTTCGNVTGNTVTSLLFLSHNASTLSPQIFPVLSAGAFSINYQLLLLNALGRSAYSQERLNFRMPGHLLASLNKNSDYCYIIPHSSKCTDACKWRKGSWSGRGFYSYSANLLKDTVCNQMCPKIG